MILTDYLGIFQTSLVLTAISVDITFHLPAPRICRELGQQNPPTYVVPIGDRGTVSVSYAGTISV
jgi:hypothetical protein